MTLTRRTALIGAALGAAALGAPLPAKAASGYATVILAPHQDDETIRLAAYIAFMADRGDALSLITATNGAATSVARRLGLTREQTIRYRNREQDTAWSWLTDGRGGPVTRLGFEDGQAQRKAIRTAVADQLSRMDGRPELYVATYHHDKADAYIPSSTGGDDHPDHVACVLAARDLATDGVTVRYARHPERSHLSGTQTYNSTTGQMARVEAAVASYRTIGQRSVPEQLAAVLATRGRSVIVR